MTGREVFGPPPGGWMTPPGEWTFHDALVRIRPIREDDEREHCAAVNESWRELAPWLEWAHEDYLPEESAGWIGGVTRPADVPSELAFAVEERATGRFAGVVGINDFRPAIRTANLGYWIRTSMAGRGLMSAAVRLLVPCAFTRVRLARLEILMEPANTASRRVAEKAGAVFEGTLRSRITIHATRRDVHLYSILPADVTGGG